jgi:hypothetical protein
MGDAVRSMTASLRKDLVTVALHGGLTMQIDKGKDKQKRGMMNSVFTQPRFCRIIFGKHSNFDEIKGKVDTASVLKEIKCAITEIEGMAGNVDVVSNICTDGGSAESAARKLAEVKFPTIVVVVLLKMCCMCIVHALNV